MKKIVAVLLALMMLSMTGLCLAATPEYQQWELIYLYRGGELSLDGTYPFITLYLYADQTFRMENATTSGEGTYVIYEDGLSGVLTMNDKPLTATVDPDTYLLSIPDESTDTVAVFRERAEMAAGSIDAFQGTWRFTAAIRNDRLFHMDSEAGQDFLNTWQITDPVMTVEGSKVTLMGNVEGEGEVVDGKLIVTSQDVVLTVTLTKDNFIVVDIPNEDSYVSRLYADKE